MCTKDGIRYHCFKGAGTVDRTNVVCCTWFGFQLVMLIRLQDYFEVKRHADGTFLVSWILPHNAGIY